MITTQEVMLFALCNILKLCSIFVNLLKILSPANNLLLLKTSQLSYHIYTYTHDVNMLIEYLERKLWGWRGWKSISRSICKGIRSIFYGRRTLQLAEIGPDKERTRFSGFLYFFPPTLFHRRWAQLVFIFIFLSSGKAENPLLGSIDHRIYCECPKILKRVMEVWTTGSVLMSVCQLPPCIIY